jgi:hypothetical protein
MPGPVSRREEGVMSDRYADLPPERRQQALGWAWSHAYMWATNVQRLADRLLDTTNATMVERIGDGAALTLAVRNVLRAAEMAHDLADGDKAEKMAAAIDDFKRALPDVVKARNVLEHFDEYTVGQGWMQQKQSKAGQAVEPYRMWCSADQGSYVFELGPLRVDALTAREAAAQLAAAVGLVEPPPWKSDESGASS